MSEKQGILDADGAIYPLDGGGTTSPSVSSRVPVAKLRGGFSPPHARRACLRSPLPTSPRARAGRPHRSSRRAAARPRGRPPRAAMPTSARAVPSVEFHAADAVIWVVDGTSRTPPSSGSLTNAVLTEANLRAITLAQYIGTRYATPQRLRHATGDVDHPSGVELGAAFDRHYIALALQTAGFFPGVVDLVALAAVLNKSQAVLSTACASTRA